MLLKGNPKLIDYDVEHAEGCDSGNRFWVNYDGDNVTLTFKVSTWSEDGQCRVSFEMLQALSLNHPELIRFSFNDELGGMMLVLSLSPDRPFQLLPEYPLGVVPEPLAFLLRKHWDNIADYVEVEQFSLATSVFGLEAGHDRMMRMIDDEEVFDRMSQDEYDRFMASFTETLDQEMNVVKVRLRLSRAGRENGLLPPKGATEVIDV